jgi:dihydroceramide fatty acyl 2-hydroxylase
MDINRSKEPIRLFRSDLLEAFTHVHPTAVLVVWVPVAVYLLVVAAVNAPTRGFPIHLPLGFLVGLFVWTLAEYMGHRFVFHFQPRAPWQDRLLFVLHGVHHLQPQIKTRLVMPPLLTIPLAVPVYGVFYLLWGLALGAPPPLYPAFAGFVVGYVSYDMLHYATHHFPLRWRTLKALKRHHMLHHFKTPQQRFGVSSPLWDIVCRTHETPPPKGETAGGGDR